ncbi:nuclear transcription factor Y subunit B-3 [Rhizophagus clarus]|uniref:Nuclear transcription factor Y subunit B-3 n=1 Tax=Rhizophagus clarus TaxID=94130 RepID=A0A8H3LB42_9GLOM|nr:nuclear transcription factor Y subunit B-3 [Rhizophagus clarus]
MNLFLCLPRVPQKVITTNQLILVLQLKYAAFSRLLKEHTHLETMKNAYKTSDRCQQEKRKTINGEDILWAMQSLGFENYADALKIYLAKYRETTKIERSSANSKEKEEEGANVNDMYQSQQSQQHATAGYYPVQHQNFLGDNNPS